MPASPTVCSRMAPAISGSRPTSRSSIAATGPWRIFLGRRASTGPTGMPWSAAAAKVSSSGQLPAVVVQQPRDLRLAPRSSETPGQQHRLLGDAVGVGTAPGRKAALDERLRGGPVDARHR